MCKWEATFLTTAACKLYPDSPHQYQDRVIWPCKHARLVASDPDKWKLCNDFVGKNGEAIEEGSYSNRPCPVCRTLDQAKEEFEEAERRAESKYNEALALAKKKLDKDIEGSTLVINYRFDARRHGRH